MLSKIASDNNKKREAVLRGRDRLLPCIIAYDELLEKLRNEGVEFPEKEALAYPTSILRSTYEAVLQQIKDSGKEGIAAINAVKRSAGTNYQGLCEYGLMKWLETTDLPFCIGPNAPKSMKHELTIIGSDVDGGDFSVEPDIDISLWLEDDIPTSPIIFISAKTSLVDRAGQAARWKMYLDMHQTTCTHIKDTPDCPIHRTKVRVKTQHPITHSIVTANIYKIDTTQPEGELGNGQCRNNTYMFKHKYTTRNDEIEYRPDAWKSFSEITTVINSVCLLYTSPSPRDQRGSRMPSSA